jgi:hypothetical protein
MADDSERPEAPPLSPSTAGYWDHYVNVYAERPEGDDSTCLRPLGNCELGDCCDVCLHNPNRVGADGERST